MHLGRSDRLSSELYGQKHSVLHDKTNKAKDKWETSFGKAFLGVWQTKPNSRKNIPESTPYAFKDNFQSTRTGDSWTKEKIIGQLHKGSANHLFLSIFAQKI